MPDAVLDEENAGCHPSSAATLLYPRSTSDLPFKDGRGNAIMSIDIDAELFPCPVTHRWCKCQTIVEGYYRTWEESD